MKEEGKDRKRKCKAMLNKRKEKGKGDNVLKGEKMEDM